MEMSNQNLTKYQPHFVVVLSVENGIASSFALKHKVVDRTNFG